VAFGGRLLAENDRDEQRKLIKYNHRKPSVSRFDALQDVKPAHRRLTLKLGLDCGDDPAFIRFDEKRRGDHRALEQGS
jgi:hypothetical protein